MRATWRGNGRKALNDAGTFLGDRFADVSAWFDEVGSFFSERSSEMSQSVAEAWETLKDGAEQTGAYTQEQLDMAYRTIRDWFRTSGETAEESVLEAVDNIAEAAGVRVEEEAVLRRPLHFGTNSKGRKENGQQKRQRETDRRANPIQSYIQM